MATGLASVVSGVLQPSLYKLWTFAAPAAELSAARSGLEHLLARFHERQLEAEVQNLEGEVSEEGQTRLKGLQEQLKHSGIRGTTLDDDGFNNASEQTVPARPVGTAGE
jgi:hypothetical protein